MPCTLSCRPLRPPSSQNTLIYPYPSDPSPPVCLPSSPHGRARRSLQSVQMNIISLFLTILWTPLCPHAWVCVCVSHGGEMFVYSSLPAQLCVFRVPPQG